MNGDREAKDHLFRRIHFELAGHILIEILLSFVHQRCFSISSTVGMRLVAILEKMGVLLRDTSKAPVEEAAFWSMLRPKQPPSMMIMRFCWNCWQRGWLLMAGMKPPPIPTTIRPVCSSPTPFESIERRGGRGYSSPMTRTSGRRQLNFSLSCSKALPQDQLLQNCTSRTTLSPKCSLLCSLLSVGAGFGGVCWPSGKSVLVCQW